MPTDERVLCVPTYHFRAVGYLHGFRRADADYAEALLDPAVYSFRPRSQVETDPSFKQLIPYVVFRCADRLDGALYYESVDLIDAYHPQTIVAHSLNGEPLPEANGAPLRMRIERQLGYKHAKYLTGIEAVASLDDIAGGKGGYWEDRGYQWYAGV